MENENEIVYDKVKDFYKAMGGELRYKAEGLFKKAKEKGISIEDIEMNLLNEENVEIPGLGKINLPTYFIKVKGVTDEDNRTIVDGKQISFYNIYQKYLADKIAKKNAKTTKDKAEFELNEWELFEVGKAVVQDKEFGVEKTITGACDRVIRKLMGENDWITWGEAKLLEDEFNEVDRRITEQRLSKDKEDEERKASERQLKYFRGLIKNAGMDDEDQRTIHNILKVSGIKKEKLEDLVVSEMSRLIQHSDKVFLQAKKLNENIS
jgi:hypothetical protein